MMASKTISSIDTDADAGRQREIEIKQIQLKIAQEGNMPFVAEAIQRQLEELQAGNNHGTRKDTFSVSPKNDSSPQPKMDDFQALMSLLDD